MNTSNAKCSFGKRLFWSIPKAKGEEIKENRFFGVYLHVQTRNSLE
jgi:hypothetical protein